MFAHASSHFTTDELREIRSRHQRLEYGTEARLVYHLADLCPACWAAIRKLPPPESELKASKAPVVLALRRLTSPHEALLELDANHRASVLAAGERVLGFCFLLLEEVRKGSPAVPRDAARYLPVCAGTVAGSGVLLLHVPEAHDLHARYFSLLALALCGAKDLVQAREAVALAKFHAEKGTGLAEVRAGCLEAEASVASLENRRDRAWELLEDAAGLLVDHHPPDRRAETLLYLGTAMLAYNPGNRIQGSGIYKEALAILDRVEPGTNPRVRLHLIHQLVPVLLEIALENLLNRTGGVATLREAEEYLRGSESLYHRYGTPLIEAERSGYLGIILLDSDYARASIWLREATARFCELDAVDAAVNLTLRLTLFGAVKRPPGDPGDAHARLCFDVWQFPEQRRFYLQVQDRLHELLVTKLAGTEPWERLQQLRISLGEIKAQLGGAFS